MQTICFRWLQARETSFWSQRTNGTRQDSTGKQRWLRVPATTFTEQALSSSRAVVSRPTPPDPSATTWTILRLSSAESDDLNLHGEFQECMITVKSLLRYH
jgi:hypothetical protein